MHDLYYWDDTTHAMKQYIEGDTFPVAVRFMAPVHDINTWSEVRQELAQTVASIDGAAGYYVLPCGTVYETFKYGDPNENAELRLLWEISDEPDIMTYVARKLAELAQHRRENFQAMRAFMAAVQAAPTGNAGTSTVAAGGTGGPYMGP